MIVVANCLDGDHAGHVGTGFDQTKLHAIGAALKAIETGHSPFRAKPKTNTKAHWVEPTLVNRNDLVTILYQHGGLSITLQAKAMANGVKDQVIEVENTSSHKLFNARVVDERTLVYAE